MSSKEAETYHSGRFLSLSSFFIGQVFVKFFENLTITWFFFCLMSFFSNSVSSFSWKTWHCDCQDGQVLSILTNLTYNDYLILLYITTTWYYNDYHKNFTSLIIMSFSNLFDEDYFTECVMKWIESNEDVFVNDIFKRRRFNRTKKIDYWETSWRKCYVILM